jgi:CTP synthase (UTP-ammonia lyase)
VIGDRVDGFEAQDAVAPALDHPAASRGRAPHARRSVGSDGSVEVDAAQVRTGAAAVWCAPGSPHCSLRGALDGIRSGRDSRVPLPGTCAGFQHGVIEFARNVLGYATACHVECDAGDDEPWAGPR